MKLGHFNDAIRMFDMSIKIDPNYFYSYKKKGISSFYVKEMHF